MVNQVNRVNWNDCRWIENVVLGYSYSFDITNLIKDKHRPYIEQEFGAIPYTLESAIRTKQEMLSYVVAHFKNIGMDFDKFNGLPPTRDNIYMGYEFGALYLWVILFGLLDKNNKVVFMVSAKNFYKNNTKLISSVFKKYPKLTGMLITEVDLLYPTNQFFEIAMSKDDIDFDSDHTDEFKNDSGAEEFNNWLIKWTSRGTEKDKMRVKNWFEKNKSHKQIFAEIHKVVGNREKFNGRLALFVERLANNENLDSFLERSGFANKEDLFMAYFEKLTDFDAETKKKFIHKYLLKEV